MSSAGEIFDQLVAHAKGVTASLVEEGALEYDDGTFLQRALIDLETDGVELFGDKRPADATFCADITRYLEARVGIQPVRALELDSALAFVQQPEVNT
jgi:hypothetical protein